MEKQAGPGRICKTCMAGGAAVDIPDKIKKMVGNVPYLIETVGMSNSQVIYFGDMVIRVEKEYPGSDNEQRDVGVACRQAASRKRPIICGKIPTVQGNFQME